MKNTTTFWLLLLGLLLSRPAAAQWTGTAPFDNSATRSLTLSVVVAPNGNLVAFGYGTGTGSIYYSTNGGASWTATGQNLPTAPAPNDLRVYQFARQGGILFAAASTGLFASLDNGVTWATRGTGLPATGGIETVRAFGGALFAGIDNGERTNRADHVYRSLDDGASWQVASTGIPSNTRGMADFASDGNGTLVTTFFGTGGNVIYRSTDNGTTWTGTSAGVPGDFLPNGMGSVGTTLLVGGGYQSGIIRSTDGGLSWQPANTGLTITPIGIYSSFASYGSTVYVTQDNYNAYLYASTDGGQTWVRDPSQPTEFLSLYVSGSTLYAGASSSNSNIPVYTRQLAAPVAPTLTGFTPTSGPVGTTVTVTGTNFTGATAVALNGAAVPGFTVVSATSLTFAVPAGASSGPIAVTTPGGTATSATAFTVTVPNPAPTISSFTPASGGAGTVVTVTGTNFTGATQVRVGTFAAASFAVVSATSLTFVVPGGTGSFSGFVTVTTPGGTATSATAFKVVVLAVGAAQALPGLAVFPNPFGSGLTVRLPQAGAATVALRDLAGRQVVAPSGLAATGRVALPATLAAGVYLLEVRQGDITAVRRIEKE